MSKQTIARKPKKRRKRKKEKKISYTRKPDDLTIDQWQAALRKQFGKQIKYKLTNLGEHPIYSDFLIKNPETGSQYKLAIRSKDDSANFCGCLDFKTNQLGTCKHLGYALNKLPRKRGYRKIFNAGYQQPHSSIYLDYRKERVIRMSIGTKKTTDFQVLKEFFFTKDGFLSKNGYLKFEKLLESARSISDDFRCYDDALEFILKKRRTINRLIKNKRLFKAGKDAPLFKSLLKIKLYDYQKLGVQFVVNAGRSLLADDMGLGKTIQAIAAAEFYKKYYKIGRVIIVCPTSLKYQWKSEIEKFTNSTAHVIEGGILKRKKQYKENEDFYQILGYRMAANDLKYLNQMEPDLIILDEAQRIKNWKTKTSIAIKKIKSPYAIVLTGTPIENRLEELYSIMQFINQFKLGPLYRFLDHHQINDPQSGKIIGYTNLKEIGKVLSDVLIRRTKKQVLRQIPKRQDKVLLVPMTEEQREVHDDQKDHVARLVAKWRRYKFLSEPDRKRLMSSLSKMRMVCDSTYVVDQETRFDTKITELICILEEFFCDPEAKVVVFSQWARMNNIVAQELEERDMPYQYLHGGVPSKKRQALLDNFRDDPECRVFLSTDAGGVGLNLQSASLVVNLDIPWNPAILEQRIARVYRMGQKRPVQVINLVATHTIEHRMLDVLKFKNAMFKGVLDDGEDAIFLSQSKFSSFMGKIEDLTVSDQEKTLDPTPADASMEEIKKEIDEQEIPEQKDLSGDPAFSNNPNPEEASAIEIPGHSRIPNDPQEILKQGMAFFQEMAKVLQSPEKTADFVKNITEKDEKSGQTFIKIPVADEHFLQNTLEMVGQFFNKIGKK